MLTTEKIKNDLPKGWKIAKLGDVFEVVTGNTPPKKDPENYGNDIPFVKPPELRNSIIDSSEDNLSIVGATKSRVLPPFSILVSCIGNLGKIAMNKIPVAFNQQINALKYSENFNPKYPFYFCQTFTFKSQLQEASSATTVAIVNKSNFEKLKIIVPPRDEQNHIVEKLEELFSELDHSITTLKATQQQLQTYRQSVLKHAFEGHFTEKNKEWSEVKLDIISSAINGFAFKSEAFIEEGKYQVVRIGNVKQGGFKLKEKTVFIDTVSDKVIKKSSLKKGDLIITLTGTRNKKDYGYVALVNSENNLLLNQRLAIIRVNNKCNPKFYLYYLMTDKFRDQFFSNETGNVGQGNVGINGIRESIVPFPATEDQNNTVIEIETRLSESDYLLQTINQQLLHAESLRQSILQRAFNGEL